MTAGAPVAAHWFADRQIGPALLRHGSSEQRSRYLPITLDDVDVPPDALLGSAGSGWQQVTAELGYESSGPERFLSTAPLLWELARRRAAHGDPPRPIL